MVAIVKHAAIHAQCQTTLSSPRQPHVHIEATFTDLEHCVNLFLFHLSQIFKRYLL